MERSSLELVQTCVLSFAVAILTAPPIGAVQSASNRELTSADRAGLRRAREAGRHAGARYSTGDPIIQQAYLKASNTDANDEFGVSLAAFGDTVVVGAPSEDSSATGVNGDETDEGAPIAGAAYVFVRSGTSWSQQAYLKASNTGVADGFGFSVAVSGDTIVVGAPGEGSDATGVNGDQGDDSAAGAGAAYVFVRNGTTWTQEAYLKASNTGAADRFGHSVAVSGDVVVVGAILEDSGATGVDGDGGDDGAPDAGAAYVFVRSGTTWSQAAYLKASNTDAGDQFGRSVAVSGDTAVVGAREEASQATGVNGDQDDDSAPAAGAAYVFVRSGSTWSQQAYLKASNTEMGDDFGQSVAVSGDTVAVGAWVEDSSATGVDGGQGNGAAQAGAVYVFERRGTIWSQAAYLKASNTDPGDHFGYSVAVSGDIVVVGAPSEDSAAVGVDGDQVDDGADDAGAVYVFARSRAGWGQRAYVKASNTGASDGLGFSAAAWGDLVAVGAPLERSAATGVNGDQRDDSAPNAGAAYVFDLDGVELGARYCAPAVPNSTGQPGVMTAIGSATVSDDFLTLVASDLPTGANIGYFLMGTGTNVFTPPGSAGPICVAPGIKRYLPPVNNTNELPGGFSRTVGTSGPVSSNITPGSTWNFQAWHRDGMGLSNLTDAVSVAFQ